MNPLTPGRLHQKRGAGDTVVFRRKEGAVHRTNLLPNRLVYIGPHPESPHLALFKNEQNPDWFYWDVPENFIALDEIAPESLIGGFRATRPAGALWGRKDNS